MPASSSTAATEIVDPLALERQLCFALAVANRSVLSVYRPILEPMGLTHPQYLVLLALWERSPRSVKDISAALQLEPATLSPLLKRLAHAGLITRTRNGGAEIVKLLQKGSAYYAPSAAVAQIGKMHFSGWPAWAAWLGVHLVFLVGFRSKISVLVSWTYSYFTYKRGARIITGISGENSAGSA